MIGNPTRPGDLAVCLKGRCAGMMVKVVGFYQGPDGQDREGVAIGGGLVRENDGSVGEAKPGEEVIFFDAHWQPIRPPAPEEHGERAEHLAGVVQ